MARTSRNSKAVRDGLAGLEPHFVKMRDAARQVIRVRRRAIGPTLARVREGLAVILDNEAEYLRRMDRVVGLYESEAQGPGRRRFGGSAGRVTGSTLAALPAIGLFIFRPAAGLIRRQVAELGQARDELEARVRERTRELEAARERHRTLLEQFSHVGRTSAIGEMASALAHELNQPLGAIANYAEGCLIELDVAGAGRWRKSGSRSSDCWPRRCGGHDHRTGAPVRDPPRAEPRVVRAEPRGRTRCWRSSGIEADRRGVAVTLDLAPGLPCLWGDPVQIQQVLVNLVRNALDSLAQSQTAEPTVVIWTRMGGPRGAWSSA